MRNEYQDDVNQITTSLTVKRNLHPQSVTMSILDDLASFVTDTKNELWLNQLRDKVSRLSLYRILYKDELVRLIEGTDENALGQLESNIPVDVAQDSYSMALLQTCATRIENMQLPRYQSLQTFLVNILKEFLSCFEDRKSELLGVGSMGYKYGIVEDKSNETSGTGTENNRAIPFKTSEIGHSKIQMAVQERKTNLEKYLSDIPTNKDVYERLLNCGYETELWKNVHEVTIKTDGTMNVEENLRQTLLASFREYAELLKQLGIPSITVDGKEVKSDEVFSDDLMLSELKGRRTIVVKVITVSLFLR